MTGNVLLRQEVETSPLSGGDGLMMTSPLAGSTDRG